MREGRGVEIENLDRKHQVSVVSAQLTTMQSVMTAQIHPDGKHGPTNCQVGELQVPKASEPSQPNPRSSAETKGAKETTIRGVLVSPGLRRLPQHYSLMQRWAAYRISLLNNLEPLFYVLL